MAVHRPAWSYSSNNDHLASSHSMSESVGDSVFWLAVVEFRRHRVDTGPSEQRVNVSDADFGADAR